MKIKKITIDKIVSGLTIILTIILPLIISINVNAADRWSFSLSPMKEKILLNPGDQYSSAITVYTSTGYDADIKYKIEVAEFYVDEEYHNIFKECGDYCEMANWIKIESPTEGILKPGEKAIVQYTINVPEDAHGGGQYASIMVQGDVWVDDADNGEEDSNTEEIAPTVKEEKKIAYTIYAEIAGDVIRQGDVIDVDVPSFLLAGDIKGTASIKNTGNVHGDATYTLQVFPLFSNEEIYTNEEEPAAATILPDRTRYEEIAWKGTPAIGIFNVLYTVEFEGVTAQVSKLVIKCPIWLLFVIIFAVVATILWFMAKRKERNKKEG